MIANLIDPYGTLGKLRKKLVAQLNVALFITLALIAVSFVVPFRSGVLLMPFALAGNQFLSAGIRELTQISSSKGWKLSKSIWAFVATSAALAAVGWFDGVAHPLPAQFAWPGPPIAHTPVSREMYGLLPALLFIGCTLQISRSRHASRVLSLANALAPAT